MMVKNKILTKVNKLLNEKKLKTLDEKEIDVIVVDVTRVLDKHITELINDYKDKMDIKVNSFEKEVLRRYLIGYPIKLNRKFNGIEKITLKEKELSEAYKLILEGIIFTFNFSIILYYFILFCLYVLYIVWTK